MPITSSAKKKMRRDVTKRSINLVKKTVLKKAIKTARRDPNAETFKKAQKILDKAVKNNLVNKNKGARLKSQLYKLSKKV